MARDSNSMRRWAWYLCCILGVLISIPSTADAARTLTLAGRSLGGMIDGAFLDPNVTLTNSGEAIASVGMQIVSGYVSGDVFSVSQALPAGYTTSWNSATQTFAISQTTPVASNASTFQSILRTVKLAPARSDSQNAKRRIEYTVYESGRAFWINGVPHFYEFVSSGIDWNAAKTAAASRSYYGRQGYLATVTSATEFTFISGQAPGDAGWLGANDATTEGAWTWVTGPESGQQFWSGGVGGSSVGGMYSNWGGSQPDNAGSAEDWLQITSGGTFNDLPVDWGGIQGYFVEYGGMSDVSAIVDVVIMNSNAVKHAAGI